MIFGTDTARYQPDGSYDPGAFEIINIEDPGFEQKTARNLRDRRPTGFYPWIYPGTNVAAFTRWAIGKARAAGANFGAWADYEQDGVTLDLLDQFFGACDELGEPAGYYGNDWRFGHQNYLTRPYWYCGYPDPNDGLWRDGYTPRASRPVQIFQFTSGGGLDRNVIWDDAWFANWLHGTADPNPTQEDDVLRLIQDSRGIYVWKDLDFVTLSPDEVPAFQFLTGGPPTPMTDANVDVLMNVSRRLQQEGAGPAGGNVDVVALAAALAPHLQLTVDAHAAVAAKA